jgi:predicted RNase H-like HicB family nuclease
LGKISASIILKLQKKRKLSLTSLKSNLLICAFNGGKSLTLNVFCYITLNSLSDNNNFPNYKNESMKFNVTIDRDEDGVWIVECPSIPGCVSQGETKDQALENIEDAITACLQVRAERGLPLTVETKQIEVLA